MQEQPHTRIGAIDLFCGAGGLSLGLKQADIDVLAGIDLDESCAYPYKHNLKSKFIQEDISKVTAQQLEELWGDHEVRLLAGCAPCQPFSSHRRGQDTSEESNWNLLAQFQRLVHETLPDFVTMENVVRLQRMEVFDKFVTGLRADGYHVEYGVLYGPDFGLPQTRRRLVLVASLHGEIALPAPDSSLREKATVRHAIHGLQVLQSGERSEKDPLHVARKLSELNLARIQASTPGGTWKDWPEELLAPCHKKETGSTFKSFYGRMSWDDPSPTITTQSFNLGTGRFGHPEQDRTLTLRESAILQGFPKTYRFTRKNEDVTFTKVGRLIGNAVPPPFGKAVGQVIQDALHRSKQAA